MWGQFLWFLVISDGGPKVYPDIGQFQEEHIFGWAFGGPIVWRKKSYDTRYLNPIRILPLQFFLVRSPF